MQVRITFVIEGPAADENRLGPEQRSVVLSFGSGQSTSNGFDALCEKVAVTLEGQGLKTSTKEGATRVTGSVSVEVDDNGAPGRENRSTGFGFYTDHSVHEARDLVVKAMEDADVKLLN
ncbi:MAG: hypothetical protein F4015_08530 [Acidimicrobiia bacterium]|nr:hypothetical protein [Acidimicrobiia bacterium]